MSSHHVVRDAQEPALLIWAPGCISLQEVQPLLEWSPRVVVHEHALAEVLGWGIKIDVLITSALGESALADLLQQQWPVALIRIASPEATFAWLGSHQHSEVNIVASIDSPLADALHTYHPHFQLQLIEHGWRFHLLTKNFEKWVPAGQAIRLLGRAQVKGAVVIEKDGYTALKDGFVQLLPASSCWVGWPLE